jgi:hypothetical protein
MFEKAWTEIFDFAANPKTFAQRKGNQLKSVKLAVAVGA